MTNPWVAKLGGDRPTKVSLRSLAKGNGRAGKPSLAGVVKKPLPKKQNKRDFYAGGVLFHNAKVLGEISKGYRDGIIGHYGSVAVSNGDKTYTLHNQFGSWMHNVHGTALMAEPARVAVALGINMSQLEIVQNLRTRFEAELRYQGILTTHEQRRRVEETQKAARSRKPAAAPVKTTTKITLKGLKK